MSPFLFLVLSTLYTGHGHCRCLMGSLSSFAYCILMKFSVAPESRSAIVSALFQDRWMNRCSCIDFHIEKYILSDPVLLIQATSIRPPKNFPLGLPSSSSAPPGHLLVGHSVVDTEYQLLSFLNCFHYLQDSSLSAGQFMCWCISVSWGNCK